MPSAYVKHVAGKIGVSTDHAEQIWKKAKQLARKHAGKRNIYAYTTTIFKSMTHQSKRKQSKKECSLVSSASVLVESYLDHVDNLIQYSKFPMSDEIYIYRVHGVLSPIHAEDSLRNLGIRFHRCPYDVSKPTNIGRHLYKSDTGIILAYYDDLKQVLYIHKDTHRIQPLSYVNSDFPVGDIKTSDPVFKKYF